jgi:hypothetical protein
MKEASRKCESYINLGIPLVPLGDACAVNKLLSLPSKFIDAANHNSTIARSTPKFNQH